MTEIAAPSAADQVDGVPTAREAPTEQTGSPLFAELVWAHYCYERERHRKRRPDSDVDALEKSYVSKLREFQDKVGELEHVYWSTKGASAVAMTVRKNGGERRKDGGERRREWRQHLPTLLEHDQRVELHRLSDWVTGDAPRVADLLHECDLLAIRVGEVLRGTPERIAMRWLLGVQAHLLGFVERTKRLPDETAEKSVVKAQRDQLVAIEKYYHRAASKAGRLLYVTGMLMGLVPVLLLGTLLGLLLVAAGLWDNEAELLLLCLGAGAIGALVSAISRMGKPEKGKFNIDFELGRPLIRRLGVYRPFLGAVAGVALYFFLASGIAEVVVSGEKQLYYYGFAAFLAGFSERFANVMFGAAERRLSGGNAKGEDEEEGS
jgi:hypothetical protein